MINERSFNNKHCQVLDIDHKWSKRCIKNLNLRILKTITPFYYFLTESRGVNKSHPTKTLHRSLTKIWTYKIGNA